MTRHLDFFALGVGVGDDGVGLFSALLINPRAGHLLEQGEPLLVF